MVITIKIGDATDTLKIYVDRCWPTASNPDLMPNKVYNLDRDELPSYYKAQLANKLGEIYNKLKCATK